MPVRPSPLFRRGKMEIEPWMGVSCYPVGPRMVGGVPYIKPGYQHFRLIQPQRPVRAIGVNSDAPLVLYNRMDQIVQIENALALQRVENQVSVTLSQLSLGIRNAEEFVANHLMNKEARPSIYQLWFHEGGIRDNQHVLSTLAAHHLVPLFSLVSYDVERGKMTALQAAELYEELMDCSVAQPKIVQRELANQMIRVYCLEGDYDKAIDVVGEMKARRIRRTFVTYAPLFRMVRAQLNAEKQVELLSYMCRTEGGKLSKFLYIDVPRMAYMLGVFTRYNWMILNLFFTSMATVMFLFIVNFGGPGLA